MLDGFEENVLKDIGIKLIKYLYFKEDKVMKNVCYYYFCIVYS
jgi:hypothetical protein